MTYKEIIDKVSEDSGIPVEIVDKTYKAFWLFIRTTIQELPLKEELTEEEFLKLRTNFNIPSLGKLACPYQKYLKVKEKFKHIKKLRENDKTE